MEKKTYYLYKIDMNEVDYEEDYSNLVSATSEEEAIITAGIRNNKESYGRFNDNMFRDNIEKIEIIGISVSPIIQIVMTSNKGA